MAIPTTKMPAHARTKAVVRVMEVPLLGSMNSSPSSSRRIEDGLGAIVALVAEHPVRSGCPRGHLSPEPAEKMKACKAHALESSSITPATEHGINFLSVWMTVAVMDCSFHQSALRNTEPEVSAPSSQRGTARWSAAGPSAFKEPDGRDTPARRHYSVVLVGRRLLLESPAHARRESSCNVYRGTADAWLPPENAKQ